MNDLMKVGNRIAQALTEQAAFDLEGWLADTRASIEAKFEAVISGQAITPAIEHEGPLPPWWSEVDHGAIKAQLEQKLCKPMDELPGELEEDAGKPTH